MRRYQQGRGVAVREEMLTTATKDSDDPDFLDRFILTSQSEKLTPRTEQGGARLKIFRDALMGGGTVTLHNLDGEGT